MDRRRASAGPWAACTCCGGSLCLLPLTGERFSRVTGGRHVWVCGSVEVPPMFAVLMVECSAAGPLAFLATEQPAFLVADLLDFRHACGGPASS